MSGKSSQKAKSRSCRTWLQVVQEMEEEEQKARAEASSSSQSKYNAGRARNKNTITKKVAPRQGKGSPSRNSPVKTRKAPKKRSVVTKKKITATKKKSTITKKEGTTSKKSKTARTMNNKIEKPNAEAPKGQDHANDNMAAEEPTPFPPTPDLDSKILPPCSQPIQGIYGLTATTDFTLNPQRGAVHPRLGIPYNFRASFILSAGNITLPGATGYAECDCNALEIPNEYIRRYIRRHYEAAVQAAHSGTSIVVDEQAKYAQELKDMGYGGEDVFYDDEWFEKAAAEEAEEEENGIGN